MDEDGGNPAEIGAARCFHPIVWGFFLPPHPEVGKSFQTSSSIFPLPVPQQPGCGARLSLQILLMD